MWELLTSIIKETTNIELLVKKEKFKRGRLEHWGGRGDFEMNDKVTVDIVKPVEELKLTLRVILVYKRINNSHLYCVRTKFA